jgi:hypothetical protein
VLLFASEQFDSEQLSDSVTEQEYSNQRIVIPTRSVNSESNNNSSSML